jgi:hypothetical protein
MLQWLWSALTRMVRRVFLAPARPAPTKTTKPAPPPARPLMMESVEPRQMLSVSTNAGGWTVITPAADSRVIYVSSSQGSDQNNGLSQSSPIRTIAKAGSLMRDGSADEMLLRRGDTWHETFGLWSKSGRSATEPMVIGAYGSGPRPVVASGTAVAFNTGRSSHPRVDHLAILGIRFWADARDPSSPTFSTTAVGGGYGLRFADASNDLLIEDCAVQGYATDIAFYSVFGPSTNVRVRRCVVTDAYAKTGNSAGLFAYLVNGLTLDGNVFDHNGWNTKVGAVATMFNHDCYIKENVNGFVARGNLFSNASSHGLQARSGGLVENNVFLNDPIGMSFGLVNGGPMTPGGVTGTVRNNVFLGGGTINGIPRGAGIELGNTKPGGNTQVTGNVFAHNPAGPLYAFNLEWGQNVTNASQAVGLNDLTISGNVVYDWARGLSLMPGLVPGGKGLYAYNRVTIANNIFQHLVYPKTVPAGNTGTLAIKLTAATDTGAPAAAATTTLAPVAPIRAAAVPWATAPAGTDSITLSSNLLAASAVGTSRTAGTYAAERGLGSGDAGFINSVRSQSSQAWNTTASASALVTYIRSGFGLG